MGGNSSSVAMNEDVYESNGSSAHATGDTLLLHQDYPLQDRRILFVESVEFRIILIFRLKTCGPASIQLLDSNIRKNLKLLRNNFQMADGVTLGTKEIRDLTRIERIGAHSHIRGTAGVAWNHTARNF